MGSFLTQRGPVTSQVKVCQNVPIEFPAFDERRCLWLQSILRPLFLLEREDEELGKDKEPVSESEGRCLPDLLLVVKLPPSLLTIGN